MAAGIGRDGEVDGRVDGAAGPTVVRSGPGDDDRPVRLLVTNDDGIDSPGLHALAQRMSRLGEVTVFAPSGEYSGAGAAIGHLGQGVPEVSAIDHPAMPDVAAAYHLDGPPALASLLACHGLFGEPPDAVVSGINPGWNVGHAVHFSGTIGACITASVSRIGGLAISQRRTDRPLRWEAAAEAAARLLPEVLERPVVLNVNVDNLPFDQLRGIRRTGLADRVPYGIRSVRLSGTEVVLCRSDDNDPSTDLDTGAVLAGWISVTELTPTGAARPGRRDGVAAGPGRRRSARPDGHGVTGGG
jgi:5'-nucleotidase